MPQTDPLVKQNWFILAGDTFQGPMSEDRLRELLDGAAVAQDALVWCEDQAEWRTLADTPQFAEYLPRLPVLTRMALPNGLDFVEDPPSPHFIEAKNAAVPESEEPAPVRRSNEEEWLSFFEKHEARLRSEEQKGLANRRKVARSAAQGLRSSAALWIGGVALCFATAALTMALATPWLHAPQASIRSIEGLTPEDRRELESAAGASLKRAGPRVALAVAMVDAFAPSFVIASNLPQGTQFSLQIDGIPETLVGRFKVSLHTAVISKDNVARSPVFRQENGAAYPLGKYRVQVSCANCPGVSALQLEKTFFLGQEVLKGDYQRQLSTYHARLRQQAKDELDEIKQLAESLENQLGESEAQFRRFLTADLSLRADTWSKFHRQWGAFQEQLESAFSHWTPEALDGAYFYASYYSALRQAGERVRGHHQAAGSYLETGKRDPAQAARISKEAAEIKFLIQDLRDKVRKTTELTTSAEGFPPRLASR